MSFECQLCHRSFATLSLMLAHVRIIHASSPGFRIGCYARGCSRLFTSFCSYRNHVYTFHGGSSYSSYVEPTSVPGDEDDGTGDDAMDASGSVGEPESTLPDENQVQRAAALTLLKIREVHRLPQSVMGAITADFQSLFDVALTVLKHSVTSTLQTAEVNPETTQEVTGHFEIPSSYTSLFRGLQTQHQHLQYCKRHFNLVVSDKSCT